MNIFYIRISFCISPCVTETCLLTGPHLRPVGERSEMHRRASRASCHECRCWGASVLPPNSSWGARASALVRPGGSVPMDTGCLRIWSKPELLVWTQGRSNASGSVTPRPPPLPSRRLQLREWLECAMQTKAKFLGIANDALSVPAGPDMGGPTLLACRLWTEVTNPFHSDFHCYCEYKPKKATLKWGRLKTLRV